MMRIVAGKFRSRHLKGPRGDALRPTSDRLRETLFDILQTAVGNSFFVDAFAGTGAVGLEALSRGARRVVFIEKRRAAIELIRANLAALGVDSGAGAESGIELLPLDAARGIELLAARGAPADFIFLDPPYALSGEYQRILELLDRTPLVAPHTRVIIERARKLALPERLDRLGRVRVVEQGDAALDFYVPRHKE
jgi:16S rRNA (guanine966-N2)-methyltransferase